MKFKDILVALLVVAILGVNFVAIKIGVAEIPPLLLTGLRFFFAAIPAIFFIRLPKVAPKFVVGFGFMLGVVQFGLLFTAIHLGMPAGLSSVVIQMQVFFSIALAYVSFGETPSRLQIVGGIIAGIGILLLGILKGSGASPIPFLLVLGAGAAWGVANTITKGAGRTDMLAFVVWGSLVAPLPLFLLSVLVEGGPAIIAALSHPSAAAIGAVAFLAYPTTLLAFALWTNLLSRYPAATVTPFGLLVPIAGIASTHLILGEVITSAEVLGSVFVLAGLTVNLLGASNKLTGRGQRLWNNIPKMLKDAGS